MTELDRSKTCCFSGYRPHKFSFDLTRDNENFIKLENNITNAILDAYEKGYRNFLCGGAMGFDLLCGETVALLKEKFPDIRLVSVLPFKAQAKAFPTEWKDKHEFVLAKSDEAYYLSEAYVKGCFLARNTKMIDSSSMIIVYFNGRTGGTANTVAMAQREQLEIVNLYERPKKRYDNISYFVGYK